MVSLTKHPLAGAELESLVRKAFGPDIRVARWSELTDGSYNAPLTLDDGRDLVLKVAPSPHLRLLTHEVDLMRTEVDVYRNALVAGVPVPTTVYADFDRQVIGTDYTFLSRVDGVAFDTVRPARRTAGQALTMTAEFTGLREFLTTLDSHFAPGHPAELREADRS
jgi:aminoglycoside phosphotransferase (APT) family kinase protein